MPALIGLGALLAASVQSSTGLGFALMLTPILFGLLSSAGAIVLVTVLGLELNLLVLLGERRRPHTAWNEVVPIVVAALPGTVCGLLLLRALTKPVLQVAVGVVVIAVALARLLGDRGAGAPGSAHGRLLVGFTTGALTTSTGVSGPPLAFWLARRGMTPPQIRDSLSMLFLAIGLVALVILIPVFPRAHLDVGEIAVGLGCVIAGHAIGRRAFARIEAERFGPLLMAVIVCTGVASIVAGVSGL